MKKIFLGFILFSTPSWGAVDPLLTFKQEMVQIQNQKKALVDLDVLEKTAIMAEKTRQQAQQQTSTMPPAPLPEFSASDPTESWIQAAAALDAIQQAPDAQAQHKRLFEGEVMQCQYFRYNTQKSCCAQIEHHAEHHQLNRCQGVPLAIMEALMAQRAHRITAGEHCNSKNKCKKVYCVFHSSLANTIQTYQRQGNWGTTGNPSCEGLTLETFVQLDLTPLNFSSEQLRILSSLKPQDITESDIKRLQNKQNQVPF